MNPYLWPWKDAKTRRQQFLLGVNLAAIFYAFYFGTILLTAGGPDSLYSTFFAWNFQTVDLLFFGYLMVAIWPVYGNMTLPIAAFCYSFSEFISWFYEKAFLYVHVISYHNYYPANDFPVNPLLLAAVSFLLIVLSSKKPFTSKYAVFSIIGAAGFANFIFNLNQSGMFQVWWTHPLAYGIQALMIIPLIRERHGRVSKLPG